MTDITIKSSNIKATEYGIEFTGKPSIKEWYQAVQAVQKANSMCQWYLGDLIVYAESPVTGWGQSKYDDLMEATGYEYSTVTKFASMARRFPPSFREQIFADDRKRLSFDHFYQVASLEDEHAFYFLGMVQDGGWSVARLREEVVRHKNGGSLPPPREPKEPEELPDGWSELRQAPTTGYVAAPEPVGAKWEKTYLIELTESELKRLRKDYAKDPTMESLCDRIDTALGD